MQQSWSCQSTDCRYLIEIWQGKRWNRCSVTLQSEPTNKTGLIVMLFTITRPHEMNIWMVVFTNYYDRDNEYSKRFNLVNKAQSISRTFTPSPISLNPLHWHVSFWYIFIYCTSLSNVPNGVLTAQPNIKATRWVCGGHWRRRHLVIYGYIN